MSRYAMNLDDVRRTPLTAVTALIEAAGASMNPQEPEEAPASSSQIKGFFGSMGKR